jgi:hypothetical protein
MSGQDQDSYGGALDAGQAPNMYLDTVAVYSSAWSAAFVATTKDKSCVDDLYDTTLFTLYRADGTANPVDHKGNNPSAAVTFTDTMTGTAQECSADNFKRTAWYLPGANTNYKFAVAGLTLPTPAWTIELWVYPLESSAGKFLFGNAAPVKANCPTILAKYSTINVWHHIVVTYDGTTTNVYDDGVLDNSKIHEGFCGTYTECSFMSGQDQDSYGGALDAGQAPNMYLDTVAVYSSAWSAAFVAATASATCVDRESASLYSLYVPGSSGASSGTVIDELGNNPAATVTAMDAICALHGITTIC